MRILFLGATHPSTTARHRADALVRLGHEVKCKDPYMAMRQSMLFRKFAWLHYRTGYRLLQPRIRKLCREWVREHRGQFNPDLIWVESGEFFGASALDILKTLNKPVVLFNHDDPTGPRDFARFRSLVSALPKYDVVAAVRDESEAEMRAIPCRQVVRIWRSYDEVAHHPLYDDESLDKRFESDVCFIGTWIRHEKRDEFLCGLIARGINVAIWGDRWQKSPLWASLKDHWRGTSLSGRDYVAAISGAKVCLGLLSKGNRDLHTTRTMEIPYAGGLLCAERTPEHQQLYVEGEEAEFWSSVDECASKCLALLADPARCERIRAAGMKRVRANAVGNEDACRTLLEAASSLPVRRS
jgi:hypothetical protein